MPRPSVVKKQYPKDFIYIVNYYLKNLDFYDYRSSLTTPKTSHLTVGIEENGFRLPALTTGYDSYFLTRHKDMLDAFTLWLQKRKIFLFVIKECPKASASRVKELVDYLDCK